MNEPAAPGSSSPAERAVILVIEPDSLLRGIYVHILERAGHAVMAAGDGNNALELVRQSGRPLALLVADLGLPRVAAIELWRRLSIRDPGLRPLFLGSRPGTPAAHPGPGGVYPVLARPFTPDALLDAVREALATSAPPPP